MNLTSLIPHRRATGQPRSGRRRRLLVAVTTLASSMAIAAGALAGPAAAGIVPVASCHLNATVTLAPTLTTVSHTVGGNIQGTVSACGLNGSSLPDTGQFFANSLTGPASKTSESLSGQAVIIWPASANLNPSVAAFSISVNANGLATYSGTVQAGAFTGQRLQGKYKIVRQATVNQGGYNATVQTVVSPTTGPLQILENLG